MIPVFVKKLLATRSFLVVNLVIFFFITLSFGRLFLHNTSIQNEIDALQTEKESLAAKNSDLLSLADQLQTKFYIEKEGRKKYGLQKTGEELVIVKGESSVVGTPTADPLAEAGLEATTQEAAVVSNQTRWWWYFFNRDAFDQLNSYDHGA